MLPKFRKQTGPQKQGPGAVWSTHPCEEILLPFHFQSLQYSGAGVEAIGLNAEALEEVGVEIAQARRTDGIEWEVRPVPEAAAGEEDGNVGRVSNSEPVVRSATSRSGIATSKANSSSDAR